jgi:arylsulfatase
VDLNGRHYKNHLDGYNQLDYLSGKVKDSPRKEFMYVGDDGGVMAIRVGDWKAIYLENRAPSSTSGASHSPTCACRCSSTCGAIRSRSPMKTRTPTTTGGSTGPMCSCRCRRSLASFSRA